MMSENFIYKSPTHVANLNDMRLSGNLCDVALKVEDKELRAHKVILAANLKYFGSMFLNSFQESKQDVVPMQDVDASDLEAFITYAYTGEMLLTKSNALGLLEVADYLNEDAIKKACIDFLVIFLDANDAFRAYKVADVVGCLSLKKAAKLRILLNFGNCSQTAEYLDLDIESLNDVLNDAKFNNYESQQLFFDGIMRWIMHDPKDRGIHINDLLCLIDITNLKTSYLMDYVGSIADSIDDDYGIVKDLMSYYHRCSKIEQTKSLSSAEVLMLLEDVNDKRFFHTYNFTEKTWSTLQEIPYDHRKIHCISAALNDRIYYGSSDSMRYYLEVFNPMTRRTSILYSSNILGGLAACTCNKFVFLCGGYNAFYYPSDQVLRYDPQTGHIKTLTPMGTKTYGAVAVVYQGHLLVLGGYSGKSESDMVQKYDFATKKWSAFPSMLVPRSWQAVAVLDGKLYACGGYQSAGDKGIAVVEVYDPAINSWQLVASMNKKRDDFLVVAREGKLWAIGGDEEKTAEVYHPSKDQWQIDHEMSSGLQMRNPAGGLISANSITEAK